jgi:hypothetical protein
MSTPLVLGHAGHWAADLIFIAPVLVVFGWLGVQSLRDKWSRGRRRGRS